MSTVRRSKAIPKKVIRLQRSAGISKSRAMEIYRNEVRRLRSSEAPIQAFQVTNIIGTDNSWSNARVINRDPAWIVVNNANYVWSARNLSSNNAIISRRFRLNARRRILSGRLFLSVDNYAVVLINGRIVVFDASQNTPRFFMVGRSFDIRRFLRRGVNDIVIIAFNFTGARSASDPAGVAARLNIRLSALS